MVFGGTNVERDKKVRDVAERALWLRNGASDEEAF